MGYTHYWTHKRSFTVAQWQEIIADIKLILSHAQHVAGIPLANGMGEGGTSPEINDDLISFNGLGEDSHETFYLQRKRTLEAWQSKKQLGWAFCKTARKPYDTVVTACLCYLSTVTRREDRATHEPIIGTEALSVTSDGDGSDFLAGLEMARTALPRCANLLDLPMRVMERDRWCGPWVSVKTNAYEVHFCIDGHGYVTKSRTQESSYRFPTHEDMAKFLHRHRQARHPRPIKVDFMRFSETYSFEPDIWRATGSFDKARRESLGRLQSKVLATLFPAPAENAHQPPAYVRPGEMPENAGREFCYSLSDLLDHQSTMNLSIQDDRMVAAHKRGRHEYATMRAGIDEVTPEVRARVLYEDEDEQVAYVAGYRGDRRASGSA